MSKYRLLKDLPGIKSGAVFDETDGYFWHTVSKYMYPEDPTTKHGESQTRYDMFPGWFELIPDKPVRWRAKDGEQYWSVGINPEWVEKDNPELVAPYQSIESGEEWDRENYTGLCYFRTEEQAQAVANAIKALLEYVNTPIKYYGSSGKPKPSADYDDPNYIKLADDARKAIQPRTEEK